MMDQRSAMIRMQMSRLLDAVEKLSTINSRQRWSHLPTNTAKTINTNVDRHDDTVLESLCHFRGMEDVDVFE